MSNIKIKFKKIGAPEMDEIRCHDLRCGINCQKPGIPKSQENRHAQGARPVPLTVKAHPNKVSASLHLATAEGEIFEKVTIKVSSHGDNKQPILTLDLMDVCIDQITTSLNAAGALEETMVLSYASVKGGYPQPDQSVPAYEFNFHRDDGGNEPGT